MLDFVPEFFLLADAEHTIQVLVQKEWIFNVKSWSTGSLRKSIEERICDMGTLPSADGDHFMPPTEIMCVEVKEATQQQLNRLLHLNTWILHEPVFLPQWDLLLDRAEMSLD